MLRYLAGGKDRTLPVSDSGFWPEKQSGHASLYRLFATSERGPPMSLTASLCGGPSPIA